MNELWALEVEALRWESGEKTVRKHLDFEEADATRYLYNGYVTK
jgi:hypothetical protein